MMKKEVVIIEIGMNNLDCLTVKAVKILEKAELIILKDEICPEILDIVNVDSKIVYEEKDSSNLILNSLEQRVAILTLKSTYELSEPARLSDFNIGISSIPSVKSYLGYTAINKVPITKRGVNLGFIVVKEAISSGALLNYLDIIANTNATIVFYRNIDLLREIVWQMQLKKKGDMPIAIIEQDEKKGDWISGTIDTIGHLTMLRTLTESSLIIVGEVINQYQKEEVQELEEIFVNKS